MSAKEASAKNEGTDSKSGGPSWRITLRDPSEWKKMRDPDYFSISSNPADTDVFERTVRRIVHEEMADFFQEHQALKKRVHDLEAQKKETSKNSELDNDESGCENAANGQSQNDRIGFEEVRLAASEEFNSVTGVHQQIPGPEMNVRPVISVPAAANDVRDTDPLDATPNHQGQFEMNTSGIGRAQQDADITDTPRPHRPRKQRMSKLPMGSEPCEEYKLQCDICKKLFQTVVGLHLHHTNVHQMKETAHQTKKEKARDFKCEKCDKTFTTEHHLILHQLKHTPIRRTVKCSYCDRLFQLKAHMKSHERTCAKKNSKTNL